MLSWLGSAPSTAADRPVWQLTDAAADDLDAIFDEPVERWSLPQAVRYASSLREAFDRLARFPELAPVRGHLATPLRAHPHRSHIIVYAIVEDGIDIVRVLHGRSDWFALLGG